MGDPPPAQPAKMMRPRRKRVEDVADDVKFPSWIGPWDVIFWIVMLVHLNNAPYTKVEESFNVQAMHDFLHHRLDFASYDHKTFPGPVPRTFFGALVVSLLSAPAVWAVSVLAHPTTKILGQTICRAVLGTLTAVALGYFRRALRDVFGPGAAAWFSLLACAQFHLPFYASRPLPNTFALIACAVALADHLTQRRPARAIAVLAATAAAFRAEAAILLCLVAADAVWVSRRIRLAAAVAAALSGAAAALALTAPLDSALWGRPVWPEAQSFWLNVVQGKSAEWGREPFLWYFSDATPRVLSGSFIPAVFAPFFARKATRPLLLAFLYTLIYSFLPHKETRFLYPVLPALVACAAVPLARVWAMRRKAFDGRSTKESWLAQMMMAVAGGCLALTGMTTSVACAASYLNYPGGYALQFLHEFGQCARGYCSVHVGNLAAQTGVTRFGESAEQGRWVYDKTEGLRPWEYAERRYDYVLSDAALGVLPGYKYLGSVKGFEGWQWSFPCSTDPLNMLLCPLEMKPPVFAALKLAPQVHLLVHEESGIVIPQELVDMTRSFVQQTILEINQNVDRIADAVLAAGSIDPALGEAAATMRGAGEDARARASAGVTSMEGAATSTTRDAASTKGTVTGAKGAAAGVDGKGSRGAPSGDGTTRVATAAAGESGQATRGVGTGAGVKGQASAGSGAEGGARVGADKAAGASSPGKLTGAS